MRFSTKYWSVFVRFILSIMLLKIQKLYASFYISFKLSIFTTLSMGRCYCHQLSLYLENKSMKWSQDRIGMIKNMTTHIIKLFNLKYAIAILPSFCEARSFSDFSYNVFLNDLKFMLYEHNNTFSLFWRFYFYSNSFNSQ